MWNGWNSCKQLEGKWRLLLLLGGCHASHCHVCLCRCASGQLLGYGGWWPLWRFCPLTHHQGWVLFLACWSRVGQPVWKMSSIRWACCCHRTSCHCQSQHCSWWVHSALLTVYTLLCVTMSIYYSKVCHCC